uniref:Uricase n=1 Tax=Leucosporidium scottii TaxID=5278 RepID=A0A0H5GA57_9BASI|nr:hypothetical protein ls5930a1_00168 [Leucosporidium scottii]CRX79214.1 hypothetical protein ls5931a1_00042 [Leucosporidium scottii]
MVYLFSKQSPHCLSPEKFALDLALHLVGHYAHLHKSHVDITQLKWSRIPVAGKPHKHSFVRNGDEKRLTSVSVDGTAGKDKMTATVSSGIKDLLVLKTTESSFENYVFDDMTTLKREHYLTTLPSFSLTSVLFTAVDDRIFSTAVDCSYTIPISSSSLTRSAIGNLGIDFEAIYRSVEKTTLEIFATHNSASVQATLYQMCEKILKDNRHVGEVSYKLPNKVSFFEFARPRYQAHSAPTVQHYFAVDMAYKGVKNTAPKDAEVFMPVDAPSGLIIATVARDASAKL